MKQRWTNLLLFVVGTELVGAVSALLSGGNFRAFYETLDRPPFSPPGWIFPVAWGILYALMGVSAFLIYDSPHLKKRLAFFLYGAQLFANFLWTPVFFGLRSFTGATVVVIAMLVLIFAMLLSFWRIRKSAALLNLPYLLWTVYAAYLTIGVMVRNV